MVSETMTSERVSAGQPAAWWISDLPGAAGIAGAILGTLSVVLPVAAPNPSFGLALSVTSVVLGVAAAYFGLRGIDPKDKFLVQVSLYRILAFGIFILIWWVASEQARANVIPNPAATFIAAIALIQDGKIFEALSQSLVVYASGLFFATLVAIPVGLLMGGFRMLGRTLEVFANAFMATPRVAFIPLIIVLLGLGPTAKIMVVFLGAVMPILINTYAGVLNADGELVEMARSAGASRLQIFRRILLPGALPFIVVGLRLGATIGLINTIVAELYTAVTGIGGLLAFYGNTFQMARYFVVILTLATVGVTVAQLLRLLESRMDRWRYNSAG